MILLVYACSPDAHLQSGLTGWMATFRQLGCESSTASCEITPLDRNNIPIRTIQRLLGHENRTTTEIYLHSIGQAERTAIALFEGSRNDSHASLTQVSNEGRSVGL